MTATMTKAEKKTERQEAIDWLRKHLKPGDKAWTILRHVSASGMSRRISVVILVDGQPWDVSGFVGRAIDCKRHERDGGLTVTGCGMDMGFHLVYSLSRVLFPDGFMEVCDLRDGGYAISHAWL